MRRFWSVAISAFVVAVLACSQARADQPLPGFAEYPYVEELPEVVSKSGPVYPEVAREAGVEGVVMVQVLVNRDGAVVDTHIVNSIPMLDRAAIECVRSWRFKPALNNGQPVAVWVAIPVKFALSDVDHSPPPEFRGPRLRFRGDDGSGPAPRTRFETDGSSGRYFIDADSSDVVLVTNVDGDRVRLESPGEWVGAGVMRDSTYWGVFVYRDDARDPRNRGARGTHLGTLEPSGRLAIHGTFTNRPWKDFASTWTPLDPATDPPQEGRWFEKTLKIEPQRGSGSISRERLREIPVDDLLEHPVWPPEHGRTPGPDFEHPVWPPEWSEGDRRIVLAERMSVDVMPEVTRRVEPRWESNGRGAEPGSVVVVRARIERDGRVGGVLIARSVPVLDAAALRAVRQWRFRPARRAGRAVPVSVYVPVRFVR